MNLIPDKLQHVAKTVVAGAGVVIAGLLQIVPALPEEWQKPLAGVVGVLTVLAVYWIPNIKKVLDADEEGNAVVTEGLGGDGVVPETPVIDAETAADDNPTDEE